MGPSVRRARWIRARRRAPRVAVALGLVLLAWPASALTLTLDPGFRRSSGVVGVTDAGLTQTDYLEDGALADGVQQSIASGANVATSHYAISNAELAIDFEHARDADSAAGDYAYQAFSRGSLYFGVDVDVGYRLEGEYTAVDPVGRLTRLRVSLVDETLRPDPRHPLPGAFPFRSHQESRSTPHESFQLGLLEGDSGNGPVGDVGDNSATGTLVAGHVYGLYWDTEISAHEPTSAPATASGFVRLQIVPEPSTGLLVGAGLVVLASVRPRGPRRPPAGRSRPAPRPRSQITRW